MLVAKTSNEGIDIKINELQKVLYTQLKKAWKITDDDNYQSYPRCYRNKAEAGFVAEVFTGDLANNYEDVYYNDAIAVSSFFGITIDDKITDDNQEITTVHIVFFSNLKLLYPTATQRMDEEARLTVQKVLDSYGTSRGWMLKSRSFGVDKCLAEYPKSRQDINLKNQADQQPGHCFRFDLQLYYQPTQDECG